MEEVTTGGDDRFFDLSIDMLTIAPLAEVTELQKILPICMYCKSIRNDENYWQTVEAYLSHQTQISLSHGICPSCDKKMSGTWLDDPQSQ
jgi:hypothetical protein